MGNNKVTISNNLGFVDMRVKSAPTIDQYLCLDITSLKRLGLLVADGISSGYVTWKYDGQKIASISVYTNTTGIPFALLSYSYNGTGKKVNIPLRFRLSNLGVGGYYYFVCPITGCSCRKLYLVGDKFVSRRAFRPLYEDQCKSRAQRTGPFASLGHLIKLEELTAQKYRRETYKGKPTPYGRKCRKLYDKARAFSF